MFNPPRIAPAHIDARRSAQRVVDHDVSDLTSSTLLVPQTAVTCAPSCFASCTANDMLTGFLARMPFSETHASSA